MRFLMLTCTVGLLWGIVEWDAVSIHHPHMPRPLNPIRAPAETVAKIVARGKAPGSSFTCGFEPDAAACGGAQGRARGRRWPGFCHRSGGRHQISGTEGQQWEVA